MKTDDMRWLEEALEEVEDSYIRDAKEARRFTIELWIALFIWAMVVGLTVMMYQRYTYAEDMGVRFEEIKKSKLFETKDGQDSVDFILYQSCIYRELDAMSVEERFFEKHITHVDASIDADTPEERYFTLSGTVEGELYRVKGYASSFLLALKQDEKSTLFARNTGERLCIGADLLEKRIRVSEYCSGVRYVDKDGNVTVIDKEQKEELTALFQEMMRALWLPEEDVRSLIGEEIGELVFVMEESIPVKLNCYEGGFFSYDVFPGAYLKVDEGVFQEVCDR